jgi:hypothetical protein
MVMCLAGACGESPTLPIVPPPPGALIASVLTQIVGSVQDTAGRPLADATVEIVAGLQTVASTTSDAGGRVAFSGSFAVPVTCRASKEGYATESQIVRQQLPSSNGAVAFSLPVAPTVTIVTGNYTLTSVADNACTSLPDDVRTRTYAATITSVASNGNEFPDNTQYMVNVQGTSTFFGGTGGFPISVVGNYVAATDDTTGQIIENIGPGRSLELNAGGGSVVEAPTVSTLSFDAGIKYCELKSAGLSCSFCDARITLTHR